MMKGCPPPPTFDSVVLIQVISLAPPQMKVVPLVSLEVNASVAIVQGHKIPVRTDIVPVGRAAARHEQPPPVSVLFVP